MPSGAGPPGAGRMVSIIEVIGTTMVCPATEITMPSITASVSGREMVNSVPSPGVEAIETRPPRAVTALRDHVESDAAARQVRDRLGCAKSPA